MANPLCAGQEKRTLLKARGPKSGIAMKRNTLFQVILTVLLAAALPPTALLALEQRHPQWSVDLGKHGYSESLGTALAVTDNRVALAFDVKEPATGLPQAPAEPRSRLSLLIFDANNGTLSAKCGPWPVGNTFFNLWTTPSGNFLLHLMPLSDTSSQGPEMLLLLSPTCVELKRILLPYRESSEHRSWQSLQSPSRRTLLLIRKQNEGSDYQLRDSESLDLKSQWSEPNSNAPVIFGVSDKGLLGALPGPSAVTEETRPKADYYRTFDGAWRRLPFSHYCSFLSDDALVGTIDPTLKAWEVSKTQVTAIQLDGTTILSTTVSGVGYHVERASSISVSSDGNHFAFALDFSGAGWLWGNLDMGPEHHSVYVWSTSRAKPQAEIKLKHWEGYVHFALASSGSWFALIDRPTLTVRPLP
jgi:hypothetical protein